MNLDELRTVQAKERQKDGLQHLRETFYADVGEYLAELKAERDRAAAATDEPFADSDVQRLTDEIETVEGVVEAIYERRMGKLVKRASLAAAGMPADRDGLTAEEQDLFEDLVETIQTNKASVLDVLSGDRTRSRAEREGVVPGAVPDGDGAEGAIQVEDGEPAPSGEAATDSGPPAGDPVGEPGTDVGPGDDEPAPEDPEGTSGGDPESADVDRTTVRITADVGDILGVDEREYHLEREDVVTLPTANAEPLIDRDAAEPLD